MKNYKLLFRVNPPSYFGLPEGEKIVVPSTGQKTIESPTIDPFTGNVTGHGTVSQYRPDTHPIHLDLQLSKATLKVRDNYFELALEADGSNSAVQIAEVAMQRLIRHLVAQQGDLFTFELVQGVDVAAKAPIHQPRMVDLVRATWYKLDDLEGYIRCAAERSTLTDTTLDKALLYYEHARFLFNARGHAQPFSAHFSLLLTSAFLYLWKTISVILGEPGTDKDCQSRYRMFGLRRGFWEESVKPIYATRCKYDVAHYSLDVNALAEVERMFNQANDVCKEVVAHYSEFLLQTPGTTEEPAT